MPMVTPSTVKKLLSFCTRMVSKAIQTAWKKDNCGKREEEKAEREAEGNSLGASRFHYVQYGAGLQTESRRKGIPTLVRRDETVTKYDDTPRVRRNVWLVRDHDDRLTGIRQTLEDAHDLFRRLRVEVTRRLVGEQH